MQMEEAKEIVKIAADFLAEQEPAAQDSRLEQIEERRGYDGEWSVVLSFPDSANKLALGLGIAGVPRIYKELVVDSKAKEVVALRFWK
jgi:hypothetical protein